MKPVKVIGLLIGCFVAGFALASYIFPIFGSPTPDTEPIKQTNQETIKKDTPTIPQQTPNQATQLQQTTQVQNDTHIKYETDKPVIPFETKEYNTPYVEFSYPAYYQHKEVPGGFDDVVIFNVSNYADQPKKEVIITVYKWNRENQKVNSAELRDMDIEYCLGKDNYEIIDSGMLNDYIAVLEKIDYDWLRHYRDYYYANNTGIEYAVSINTHIDNFKEIRDVIDVLESTLKFKI